MPCVFQVWRDSLTHEVWCEHRERAQALLCHHYITKKWLINSFLTPLVCRHYSTNKWLIVFTSLLHRHCSTHEWLVKSVFTRLSHCHYGANKWLINHIRMAPLFCHHYSTTKHICTVIAPVCTPCVIFRYSYHERLCTTVATVAQQLQNSCTTVATQLHHSLNIVALPQLHLECVQLCTQKSSLIDWCCFYYFVRNSLAALLEALCTRIFSLDSWISVFSDM